MVNVCVMALESPDITSALNAELDRQKVKAGDRISFMVDNQRIFEGESIREWWKGFRQQYQKSNADDMTLCLITGEPTIPPATTSPIQGLQVVGGHGRGDSLICFDKAAFGSYGFKQGANAPVSEETFSGVKGA